MNSRKRNYKRKKIKIIRKLLNKSNKYSIFRDFKFKYAKIIIAIILLICLIYIFRSNRFLKEIKNDNSLNNLNNLEKTLENNKVISNNKGFLKIKTKHKSKYTEYNYKDNIIVYKDIYNNISYIPITDSNYIKESELISNDTYFEICDNKTLLDETKYKRSIKPKISVIIPFYNKDKFSIFIPLRSIQNQSLKDIEIIFVDDGSSDNKINEVLEEMKNDNRIILLKHKENKGTLISRVDGVRYASGEYILNIDQDDLFINNLVFENLYKKVKELIVDILQFSALSYNDKNNNNIIETKVPKNELVKQPELKFTFLEKIGENRYKGCSTRAIWNKFVRREIYLEAIEDLGDEYLNHRFFLYEDTMMQFELSQIAHSYFYYDILGYRRNTYIQGLSRDSTSNRGDILAMNQLYFIKLLLYKIDPSSDRYFIFKEWGFARCGSEVVNLNKNDIDLLKEVLEVIDELERLYKNTDKKLLECASNIKNHFGIV